MVTFFFLRSIHFSIYATSSVSVHSVNELFEQEKPHPDPLLFACCINSSRVVWISLTASMSLSTFWVSISTHSIVVSRSVFKRPRVRGLLTGMSNSSSVSSSSLSSSFPVASSFSVWVEKVVSSV